MNSKKNEQPFAAVILSKAHDKKEANQIFTDKVQLRPLFLTPTSPPPSDAREVRRRRAQQKKQAARKRLKPKPLSSSQRRELGLYDVPREGQKYALFEPLHNLWLGYIREILGNEIYTGGEGAASKLCSADFHGAEVEVVRSGCVSRVGIMGIVIKDSKFAFEIITKKNVLKLVPKEGTVFRFRVPVQNQQQTETTKAEGNTGSGQQTDEKMEGLETTATTTTAPPDKPPPSMVFEIHGEQFRFRPTDRATRKFRAHFSKRL
ncbi:putative rRNA and tRNA processing protein [Rhypophila decipiens]|uniref:Ribonuclease P protein subunit n=1 Tax=Rhypophila decipiens TaxID=261697 RepID=A0AAN7B541_9PEZI|nr:putative rRNA and tRNA processing protein [Rhypophila decipiens]